MIHHISVHVNAIAWQKNVERRETENLDAGREYISFVRRYKVYNIKILDRPRSTVLYNGRHWLNDDNIIICRYIYYTTRIFHTKYLLYKSIIVCTLYTNTYMIWASCSTNDCEQIFSRQYRIINCNATRKIETKVEKLAKSLSCNVTSTPVVFFLSFFFFNIWNIYKKKESREFLWEFDCRRRMDFLYNKFRRDKSDREWIKQYSCNDIPRVESFGGRIFEEKRHLYFIFLYSL